MLGGGVLFFLLEIKYVSYEKKLVSLCLLLTQISVILQIPKNSIEGKISRVKPPPPPNTIKEYFKLNY